MVSYFRLPGDLPVLHPDPNDKKWWLAVIFQSLLSKCLLPIPYFLTNLNMNFQCNF